MPRILLLLIATLSTASLYAQLKPVQAAFKKMMALEGDWDGKDERETPYIARLSQ